MTNETTTDKQIIANKQNAQKSTGPKTTGGKAISKYNALKHGLLSREVLLESEDASSLEDLGRRIRAEIRPAGEIELLLTDRIIANAWRLRRALEVERATMQYHHDNKGFRPLNDSYDDTAHDTQQDRDRTRQMLVNPDMEKLMRYENMLERSLYKALHELQRVQSARAGEKPPVPLALDVDISSELPNGFVS